MKRAREEEHKKGSPHEDLAEQERTHLRDDRTHASHCPVSFFGVLLFDHDEIGCSEGCSLVAFSAMEGLRLRRRERSRSVMRASNSEMWLRLQQEDLALPIGEARGLRSLNIFEIFAGPGDGLRVL